jgi:two-component system nitrogen regulation response regulator GlnG
VHVPPLRERLQDLPVIAENIMQRAVSRGLPQRSFAPGVLELLAGYAWPGNVRELENTLYRLMALSSTREITPDAVREELPHHKTMNQATTIEGVVAQHIQDYFVAHGDELPPEGVYERILPLVERPLISQALKATGGNQVKAAAVLGINRNTLRKRMLQLGVWP